MEGAARKDDSRLQRTFDRYHMAIADPGFQTALAINTNVTVTETRVLLSDIHRTVVGGYGGNSSRNVLVSDTRFIHRRMTTHRGID